MTVLGWVIAVAFVVGWALERHRHSLTRKRADHWQSVAGKCMAARDEMAALAKDAIDQGKQSRKTLKALMYGETQERK